jgi:uncharacterized membrane protein YbaN (DUF454 family)
MEMTNVSEKWKRGFLVACGTFFVGMGVLGIFLPLLPTTPFLLLAAACYARGSQKFYKWLLHNKWFGHYIKNYREKKGIPLKGKIITITLLMITIGYSILFIISNLILKAILIIIAISVTIHILTLKTLKTRPENS